MTNKDLVKIGNKAEAEISLINLEDSKGSSKSKASKDRDKDKEKKLDNSIFKLKLKNSMVFYNEIYEPL